jgi:D-aminopeptidase
MADNLLNHPGEHVVCGAGRNVKLVDVLIDDFPHESIVLEGAIEDDVVVPVNVLAGDFVIERDVERFLLGLVLVVAGESLEPHAVVVGQ